MRVQNFVSISKDVSFGDCSRPMLNARSRNRLPYRIPIAQPNAIIGPLSSAFSRQSDICCFVFFLLQQLDEERKEKEKRKLFTR
jgi:hypothetical protein